MRFSAPTREPPGGRPSRGAKLKGRGCTRQKDARNENRLGGTGAAKKAPSEQGATKAAGLGAADARLEPRQWSTAERVSRDRRRKRRCCARPLMKAKAHGACGAQHFVFINARYSLAHTKAGARSGDAGNTDFPLGFLLGGLCGGKNNSFCRQKMFTFAHQNAIIMMIPKRDALGLTSLDEFYDYARSIFTDINKCMEGNRFYYDYALQINPETLEYEIGKIDELPISQDTYPLKEMAVPYFLPNEVRAKYDAVEEIVRKYLSFC